MFDPNTNRGEIATNRLLDLLRAHDADSELKKQEKAAAEKSKEPVKKDSQDQSDSSKPAAKDLEASKEQEVSKNADVKEASESTHSPDLEKQQAADDLAVKLETVEESTASVEKKKASKKKKIDQIKRRFLSFSNGKSKPAQEQKDLKVIDKILESVDKKKPSHFLDPQQVKEMITDAPQLPNVDHPRNGNGKPKPFSTLPLSLRKEKLQEEKTKIVEAIRQKVTDRTDDDNPLTPASGPEAEQVPAPAPAVKLTFPETKSSKLENLLKTKALDDDEIALESAAGTLPEGILESELEVIEDDESEILSETADTVPEILEAAVEDESEPEHVENFVKPEILPGQLPVVSADSDENRNSTTLMSNGKTIRLSHIGNEKNQSSAHQEERADLNSLVEDSSPTHTGSSIKSTLPGPLKEILDAKKKNHVSSPGKPQALLEKLEVIKDSSREIKPDEFEANLLKTIPDAEFKTGIEKSFISLKNELNESSKKITIFQEEKVIRLLELKESSKATDIERYEVYSLPYDTGRMNIKTIEVLLDHILQNEIHPGKAAKAYCAFTSSTHLSKTQVFQTQRMKGKDLEGLIEWHARKNLPFPADHAVINYEIFRSKDKNHKDTVVLNVGGINQIESSQAQFEAANLILRQYSTIPVLMWKSFVKNYPDKDKGSFILVHIGESKTFVAVVKDHILLHSREIAISVQDLYKAVMQKIMVNGETVDIDLPMAMELLAKYGFPQVRTGVAEVFGIDLYKISIFLRPVVERITSEINRSLNYFKKQDPDLACEYMLYDGIGSSFPHLIHTINEPINLTPGYLNPIRSGNYTFQGGPVPENMLPEMGINLAMTHSEVEKQNVLPKKFRKEHKYIFLSKLAALLAIILLPIFVITGFWSHSEIRHLENQISGKTDIYSDLMLRKGDMNLYQRDVSILNDYYKFMKNDRIFSQYQISTMKLLSAIVPKDVKFTSMSFTKQALRSVVADTTSQTAQLRDILSIRGFVDSDISLSHIHLTNFRLKLEQLRYFTSVNLNIEDVSKISGDKLIFSLKLGI